MEMWIDVIVKIIFIFLSTAVTLYVIPWLEEKQIYSLVVKHVEAAEKLAENDKFDKKQWVIDRLVKAGVKVTPVVEAFIEAAVKELDIVMRKADDGGAS
jgi:hypothetical protein